jgi:hypothetical protein
MDHVHRGPRRAGGIVKIVGAQLAAPALSREMRRALSGVVRVIPGAVAAQDH